MKNKQNVQGAPDGKKENCICEEMMDVCCPYHGQDALKLKVGYYAPKKKYKKSEEQKLKEQKKAERKEQIKNCSHDWSIGTVKFGRLYQVCRSCNCLKVTK